jgi:hypothetical protein
VFALRSADMLGAMSDSGRLVVNPVRTNLSWHGRFREPAFRVFTNPAGVYAALHGYMQPHGGNLRDLGVDNAVLSDASITYSLLASGGPIVRLRLERIEVAFLDWQWDVDKDAALVDGLRDVLKRADGGLEVTVAEVSFDIWASIEQGNPVEWWADFVKVPIALTDGTSARLSLHGPNWTVAFEPPARFVSSNGLYLRYTGIYPSDVLVASNVAEALKGLTGVLKQFNIDTREGV